MNRLIIIYLIFFSLNFIYGLEIKDKQLVDILPSISETDIDLLLKSNELLKFHADVFSPVLMPKSDLTEPVMQQLISNEMNIGIEGLFFTPLEKLPSSYASSTITQRSLKLYNILLSVSTLTGLEYYSASRKKMRLLFEESWVIPDPKSPNSILPDPLVDLIPPKNTIFIHQKDKSFAKNQSQMTFLAGSNAFSASIFNISPMRYKGIIRVVHPNDMQSHLIVLPVREGLLIYGSMSAKTLNVKAFVDRAKDSFTNRVIALSGWYKQRLSQEFN